MRFRDLTTLDILLGTVLGMILFLLWVRLTITGNLGFIPIQ